MQELKEEWKDIQNYEGMYQVSNLGNIKSVDRIDSKNGQRKGKMLKPYTAHNGYLKVTLCKESKTKHFAVHRLVAETFISNPNNYPYVNHKDEIKINNKADNLEWCTAEYNVNYGTRNERMAKSINCEEWSKKSKRKVNQYTLDGVFIKTWDSLKEAGEHYNISPTSISKACNGHYKQSNGFTWKLFKEGDLNCSKSKSQH